MTSTRDRAWPLDRPERMAEMTPFHGRSRESAHRAGRSITHGPVTRSISNEERRFPCPEAPCRAHQRGSSVLSLAEACQEVGRVCGEDARRRRSSPAIVEDAPSLRRASRRCPVLVSARLCNVSMETSERFEPQGTQGAPRVALRIRAFPLPLPASRFPVRPFPARPLPGSREPQAFRRRHHPRSRRQNRPASAQSPPGSDHRP